jgi:hypothetical protein
MKFKHPIHVSCSLTIITIYLIFGCIPMLANAQQALVHKELAKLEIDYNDNLKIKRGTNVGPKWGLRTH